MELDLVAQLITSIATFLVAVILLQQLFKQNKELNLQHKDSERDHMFQRFVSLQSIAKKKQLTYGLKVLIIGKIL